MFIVKIIIIILCSKDLPIAYWEIGIGLSYGTRSKGSYNILFSPAGPLHENGEFWEKCILVGEDDVSAQFIFILYIMSQHNFFKIHVSLQWRFLINIKSM